MRFSAAMRAPGAVFGIFGETILTAVLVAPGTWGRGKCLTLTLVFRSLALGDLLHDLMMVSEWCGATLAMV